MKTILLVILCITGLSSYAGELSCSANGTTVLHIPGAFTSTTSQVDSRDEIKKILNLNNFYFDKKSQSAQLIPIASEGLITDKLTYIMNTFDATNDSDWGWFAYQRIDTGLGYLSLTKKVGGVVAYTGASAIGVANSIVKTVQQSPLKSRLSLLLKLLGKGASTTGEVLYKNSETGAIEPNIATRLGKAISLWGSPSGILNAASLLVLDRNSLLDALDKQNNDATNSYTNNTRNIASVESAIKDALTANKKLILVPHGEGGQLAMKAVANIQNYGSINDKDKLSKFVSVLATSPTTGAYTNKYDYMKNNYDKRIFGGFTADANYIYTNYYTSLDLSIASIVKDLNARVFKAGASDFVRDYLSEINSALRTDTNVTESMRDHFIEKLRERAEAL